jgi:hypothetical protein
MNAFASHYMRLVMKMEDRVLKEAERVCEIMFPSDEEMQCLLHHHLALFADFVEVQALLQFRNELNSSNSYKPEEIRHG